MENLLIEDAVERWQRDGWVLIENLVTAEEIEKVLPELWDCFPSPEKYHQSPEKETTARLGILPEDPDEWLWPPAGPGFRNAQHRWNRKFPFPGYLLNRLCVHKQITEFARRAIGSDDLRIYQAQLTGKYTGLTDYEQPMHTDRNHSWIPPRAEAPWWYMEGFLYLSDVEEGTAPTRLVALHDSAGRSPMTILVMPDFDPDLYKKEVSVPGPKGSFLAYRTDVFHRGVNLTKVNGSRFLLALGFKAAGQDWVGYHAPQPDATEPEWIHFVEGSTPEELALFGFPPPGHSVWHIDMFDELRELYPGLDVEPWLSRLRN